LADTLKNFSFISRFSRDLRKVKEIRKSNPVKKSWLADAIFITETGSPQTTSATIKIKGLAVFWLTHFSLYGH